MTDPLTLIALTSAAIAATLLIAYLLRRPNLVGTTKIWLLLGLGVFPLLTAGAGNVQGFEVTKKRQFCASCHLMTEHTADSDDPMSTSLSSRHARNRSFGDENCYVCHEDYGLYGTVLTKMGGLAHVYNYYIGGYRTMSMQTARTTIRLNKPYPNDNCMQCHSTKNELWNGKPDHKAILPDVRADRVSCASGGCHGFAHPYWTKALSSDAGTNGSP